MGLWYPAFGGATLSARFAIVERNRMTDRIGIVKHELFRSKCGSYEVRFSDGSESRFFYWDDLPRRRVRSDIFTREQALEQAKAFARAERDRDGLRRER
jgi:hypothetical protein